MSTVDIILWSSSLSLATAGILFGIIASIGATKANRQIKELVSDQFISEEASKYFFSIPENINKNNKTVLRNLKSSKKEIHYDEYSSLASYTRMAPMSKRTETYLLKTEFSNLAIKYRDTRKRIDNMFGEVIGSFDILSEHKPIPDTTKVKLIEFHQKISIDITGIIKDYNEVITW